MSATMNPEEKEEPTPISKKRKQRIRTPKAYKVHLSNSNLNSVMTVVRSGPQAAAADMARTHIKSVPLQRPQTVWVKSQTKYHPYKITRDYANPKLRRFTLSKDGPGVSIKAHEKDPVNAVPAVLQDATTNQKPTTNDA